MTGVELDGLLRTAERSAGWLGGRLGRSKQTVTRWIHEDRVPEELEPVIRQLLPPAPQIRMTVR